MVEVHPNSDGCLSVSTNTAEFEILRSGYVRASLSSSGKRLTLDDPGSQGGTAVTVDERTVQDFQLDCSSAKISEATGRLGAAGERIEITATSRSFPSLEETVAFEVYDDYPDLLLTAVA
jgi:hypothetical protein